MATFADPDEDLVRRVGQGGRHDLRRDALAVARVHVGDCGADGVLVGLDPGAIGLVLDVLGADVAALGELHVLGDVDDHRARTAADAAALAAVEGGSSAANRLAGVHGGTLVAWSRSGAGPTATVTVTEPLSVNLIALLVRFVRI